MTDDEIDDMTVDSAIKTIKQLRNQLEDYKECFANLAKERDELWKDLERVTKERDEARREVSSGATNFFVDSESAFRRANGLSKCDPDPAKSFKDPYSIEYANKRGWDCFTEEYKQRKQALDRLAELDQELGL
jgi:FtsZ-binding cell division protein ZapB